MNMQFGVELFLIKGFVLIPAQMASMAWNLTGIMPILAYIIAKNRTFFGLPMSTTEIKMSPKSIYKKPIVSVDLA
jgi:hypothetical protein